jgi:hypothetical protein
MGTCVPLDKHFTNIKREQLDGFAEDPMKVRDSEADKVLKVKQDQLCYDGVVTHKLWEGRSQLPSWMYTTDPPDTKAIGFFYATRDCWCHYDVRVRFDTNDTKAVRSSPWFFYSESTSDLPNEFLKL